MHFCVMVILCFSVANCQKDFFVIKTYPYTISLVSNYLCTTNSSFGLSWIGENAESIRGVSKFVPPLLGKNPFENIDAPENWFVQKSLDGFVNEAILDWRWENLTEYKTKLVQDLHGSLDHVPVLQNLKINFTIPLSILTDEAHIFLCNGSNVSESSCYWLLMQALGGTKTGFRKCDPNYIPTINYKFPNGSCEKFLEEITHPEELPNYMSRYGWSHFKLEKYNNQITLSQIRKNKSRVIITYVDNDTVIEATHMIIHSKRSSGLWKIHKTKYMYTTKQTNRIRFGEVITVLEDSVCISMFISMCSYCRIKLTISTENDSSSTLHEEIFNTQLGWTEIKLLKQNIREQKVVLLISTTSSGNYTNFWAISGMRQCQKKENRYISTKKSANCQLVSSTGNVLSTKIAVINNDENNCPESTVSSFCVPCSWFFKECGQVQIFEKYETTTRVSCSAGYTGIKCDSPCFEGNYGHSCKKKCGKCKDFCNKTDGKCESCIDDHSGEKCEIAPKNVRNIQVTSLSPSSVHIGWDKPLFYLNDDKKDLLYTIKYQHKAYISCAKESSDRNWKSSTPQKNNEIILTELKPYSNYSFSICVSYGNEKCSEEMQAFQTVSSETLETEEIPDVTNITPNSHEAEVTFSNVDCKKIRGPLIIKMKATCRDPWCKNDTKTNANFRNNVSIGLKNLIPFSRYLLEIKYCRNNSICNNNIVITRIFDTKPTAPKIVTNLEVYTKNENSVSLRWLPPYPPRGNLEFYILRYHYNGIIQTKISPITHCPLWPDFHCASLTDLANSTDYSIKVMAKNKEVLDLGQVLAIQAVTKIEPSDAPYRINIHWTLENNLELDWKHPNRTNGDIKSFKITITPHKVEKVNNKINKELSVHEYKLTYHYKINATYFLPSTSYKILISAFNGYEGKQSVNIDKSPPSIPSLDIAPKIINLTNTTITIEILTNKLISDKKTINHYSLFILGFDNGSNIQSHPELEKFKKDFQISLPKFKMLYTCDLRTLNASHFTIGNNEDIKECTRKTNYSLNSQDSFNITIILTNNDGNKSRYKLYYISNSDTTTSESKDLRLLALLSLLLIIPIIIVIYIKRKPIVERYNSFKNNSHGNNLTNAIKTPEETPLTSVQTATKKTKIYSKPVSVNEFEKYVKDTISSGELNRQHSLFPRDQTKPWECGAKTVNKKKNRYTNLLAYDHTRVVLEKIDGKDDSDYINANYIDGYKVPRAYIATQGPKMSTTHDFWRMIWQENVQHIAMLANVYESGKKKVEQYWPAINEHFVYGDISIQFVSNQVYSDYEHREFTVTRNGQVRKINQYHFLSWPDHGVPLYSQSLVPYLQRLLEIPVSSKSPIVVHCSAGVGRTGTILLCDICLRMARAEGKIDVLGNLQKLRDQRANMVDNVHQYKLAHLVILECLSGLKTGIPCHDIEKEVEKLLSNNKISFQMQCLEDTAWQDQIMKDVGQTKDLEVVKEKNRFSEILPEVQGCIFLPRYPTDDDKSTYINAVTVDGFQSPGRFIVTQQPMPNTVGDFWRLVAEKESSVIISLNEIDLSNKTSCEFWPTEKNRQMIPVDYITLKHANILNLESYDLITIHMHLNGAQTYTIIEIISLKNWPPNTNCPEKIEDFLTFWEDANTASRKSNSIIVTCFDGAKASGVYVAMSFIIEKMKLEQICDVCQAVRNIRHNRNHFIRNEEQFAFLYKAAVCFINGFESYANFN